MKKDLISICIAIMAILVFSRCGDSQVDGPDISLKLSPTTIDVPAGDEVVSKEITVEASESWEVAKTPDWITAKNITETGFTIDIAPYIVGKGAYREGVVAVKMGDIQKTIIVKQAKSLSGLSVTPDVIPDALEGETYGISVEASLEWTVEAKVDWITVGEITETGFKVGVGPYAGQGDSRTGVVTVSMGDIEREVTVTQNKPEVTLSFEDYLGAYVVHADLMSASVKLDGSPGDVNGPDPYFEDVVMEDMRASSPNIMTLGSFMTYDPSDVRLNFVYDETTGLLKYKPWTNPNFVDTPLEYTVYLGYMDDPDDPAYTTFSLLPEGAVSLRLNADNELIVPETTTVAGKERTIYLLAYNHARHPQAPVPMVWSYDIMFNIKFVKK